MLLLEVYPVLGPMLVQALIFFILGGVAFAARSKALSSGVVSARDAALDTSVYPAKARQAAGALNNQFETPVYFFAAAIISMILSLQDVWIVAGAWLFIIARVGHAAIFLTSNRLQVRALVFAVGLIGVLIMWVRIAVQVVTSGQPI
jgi:hypothetical protein